MNKSGIVDIELWQLIAAYAYVIVLLVIVRIMGIKREKIIVVSSIRMTLQLIIAGYVLIYLFNHPSFGFLLLLFLLMEGFAINNTFTRVKVPLNRELKKIIAYSLCGGTTISLMYFLLVVIGGNTWSDPRYFIPIAGMLIGNSMTGISLGINRLIDSMRTERDRIEGALMLGATPKMASKDSVNKAFDASILPTINSMLGMGIVFLPGMMTGQILSGTSPLIAIKYQIAIMLGILGSVAFTVLIFVHRAYKVFFNKEAQLLLPEETDTKK
ncbi:MAG TPA: iron export ABC transporter permease subunit FetB [Dysgonamonadaceae bacterium]|jgi:putative ABC transport system permease protein|nr:iron export ABC transporter permease subunit FetB [Dysgonamonadaceae bacterium]